MEYCRRRFDITVPGDQDAHAKTTEVMTAVQMAVSGSRAKDGSATLSHGCSYFIISGEGTGVCAREQLSLEGISAQASGACLKEETATIHTS